MSRSLGGKFLRDTLRTRQRRRRKSLNNWPQVTIPRGLPPRWRSYSDSVASGGSRRASEAIAQMAPYHSFLLLLLQLGVPSWRNVNFRGRNANTDYRLTSSGGCCWGHCDGKQSVTSVLLLLLLLLLSIHGKFRKLFFSLISRRTSDGLQRQLDTVVPIADT
jgi:hypothetical protein